MAAGLGARAAELAATKYSYDAYLERTREVVARVTSAPRAAGGRGRGVTRDAGPRASAPHEHYSYTAYADPGDGGSL